MESCYLIKSFALIVVMCLASSTHVNGQLQTPKSYPEAIMLSNCGSLPSIPVVNAEPQIITTLEKPPLNPSPREVPAPKVVGHTLHIYKTVLKPHLFRQLVIVPCLRRYIRTFQVPVLETTHIQQEIPV